MCSRPDCKDDDCSDDTQCFRCKIRTIGFTYQGGREVFHGD